MDAVPPGARGTLPVTVIGPIVCEPNIHRVVSRGLFNGENPIHFPLTIIIFQVSLLTLFSAIFHVLFRPLRFPKFASDIMGGVFMGPSFLAYNEVINKALFLPKSVMNLDVYENLGLLFLNFLLGVKIDVSAIQKSGHVALVMGFLAFLFPFITNYIMGIFKNEIKSVVFANKSSSDQESMQSVGFLQSVIFFQVTYDILKELKLLNSELGRLAISCAMISSILSWGNGLIFKFLWLAKSGLMQAVLWTIVSGIMLVIIICYIFRPMMLWMIKETPEGTSPKESYICVLILMVLGTAMFCQTAGLPGTTGAALLGFVVPAGSTLALALVEKLEAFVLAVLVPSFVVNIGRKVDIHLITMWGFWQVELAFLAGMIGKVLGCIVPSFIYNVPFVDALVVGLLLSCQGLLDIHFFSASLQYGIATPESFSIIVSMSIVHLAVVVPWVSRLYDPSRRYVTYRKRTIQHAKSKTELRILTCIIQEEDVLSMINVLEASNASRESQIGVYVLDLVDLAGRALPMLIPHRLNRMPSNKSSRTNRIIRAFHQYEVRNEGLVSVQCFTSIAPFSTIHEDICSMALEKITSLVIIPFHVDDGNVARKMVENVVENSPCSVGILVDRGKLKESRSTGTSWFNLKICVIFMGGSDDREALAYGTRMAEHPNVSLTVINIFDAENVSMDTVEAKHDMAAIHDFKLATIQNSRVVYKEEGVASAEGMTIALGRVEGSGVFDLIMVGRRHDDSCALVSGLFEWCEMKELGVVGDMLLSPDFKSNASVLVIQQQASMGDQEEKPNNDNDNSESLNERNIKSIDSKQDQQQFASGAMIGITSPTQRDIESCTNNS
ncbi:cation/H(+) antiporter 27-like [Impatiens glandulifera]|uniref:cation/H(+) antiporter 27-like n=1 Tax=Impatiens glandulifera TaxID=253017 RepID=UPI001FB156D4|nr:cation/H(+) antiporter 27-like [Impatiens glandulifera]